jgi:hypothetical protein
MSRVERRPDGGAELLGLSASYNGEGKFDADLSPEEVKDAMPRCETCRHWGSARAQRERDPDFRPCTRIEDAAEKGVPSAGQLAYTRDAEEYASVFGTAATFGCVLWEPKT